MLHYKKKCFEHRNSLSPRLLIFFAKNLILLLNFLKRYKCVECHAKKVFESTHYLNLMFAQNVRIQKNMGQNFKHVFKIFFLAK